MPRSNHGYEFFGSLESVRGIAALTVVLFHAFWVNPLRELSWVHNTYLMLDMFFVLSGFVICHAYADRIRDHIELRDFFLLRLGRLYPLHLTLLGVWVAIDIVKTAAASVGLANVPRTAPGDTASGLVSNLLLVHAIGLHEHFSFNVPSWTISTEFYTYVVFAVIVLAIGPQFKRWQLPSFLAISAVCGAILLAVGHRSLDISLGFAVFRCGMGFFLGAATYLVYKRADFDRRPVLRAWAPYVAATVLVAICVFMEFKRAGPSDVLFLALAVTLILSLAASSGSWLDRWLRVPPLAHLGRISYSIYMVHYLLVGIIAFILTRGFGFGRLLAEDGYRLVLVDSITGTTALMLYGGAVLGLSTATFKYIEDPCRRRAKAFVAGLQERERAADPAVVPAGSSWRIEPDRRVEAILAVAPVELAASIDGAEHEVVVSDREGDANDVLD